ncbi:DUF1624 domain-containing protein [Motilimonas pumila]|uniref:DUF1624 domain-containing protein n=1 Tax=Motilimonas pumila TaxID=2303987 RepID=UPI001E61807D|nr:heparan-alpha-glucosaminide N-acetyltransferase domain-containing protein [Motilimonas pumila]
MNKRIISIDVLRGMVMLIMLLDHVRERIFYHQQVGDPMDLSVVEPALFFTRLMAHWCAPTFVFLTGISAWLYSQKSAQPKQAASTFLLQRGVFILLLEVTVINFSWFGSYDILYLQVMWAIGVSMIVLAGLLFLPRAVLMAVGFIIVFGHDALVPISFEPGELGYSLWTMLHQRGMLISDGPLAVRVSYPVLPWIGLIVLGYCLAPLFAKNVVPSERQGKLLKLGLVCFALLAVLRGFNIYGEALPWSMQDSFITSVMSFLNFTKYGPSLDFMLLTIGLSMVFLSKMEHVDNRVTDILKTFGSAPLFFYVLHLYVLLISYEILKVTFGSTQGELFGVDYVWQVWAFTIPLAALLYFPTKAFSRYKHSHKNSWVKFL